MSSKCPKCGHEYDPDVAPELGGGCPRCVAEFLRSRTDEAGEPASAAVHEDDPLPLEPGAKLRGFEVLEYLGRGGMGFVYKARQAGLGRAVALKVLAPRLAASPEFAARFDREAKALAALSHPNIVQVFDYGREGELYFLAMEFVDGASLRQILGAQRIRPETALRYVPQICDALEYAHSQGVIHRDIKPENILIDRRGNLKIADFGLAKIAAGTAVRSDAPTEPAGHATVSGQVMGTPHYMAPEQVENMAAVDHRADIYSLGVVFYEMLTGELPLGKFPVPSQKVQVDVRFDEVVLRALEKEPEKRYQRASEIKTAVALLSGPQAAALSRPSAGHLAATAGVRYGLLLGFRIAAGAFACLLIFAAVAVAEEDGLAAALLVLAGVTGIAAPFMLRGDLNALIERALVIFAGLMACSLGSVYLRLTYPVEPHASFWNLETNSLHWHGAAGVIAGMMLMWGAALLLRRPRPLPAVADPVTPVRPDARLSGPVPGNALPYHPLAVASPALAAVGLLLAFLMPVLAALTLVPALVLGIIGRRRIRREPGRFQGTWAAVLGIWMAIPTLALSAVVFVTTGLFIAVPLLTAEPDPVIIRTDPIVDEAGVSWGLPIGGLQVGLSAKQRQPQAGQPLEFVVHFRNTGRPGIAVELPAPGELVFRPEGGDDQIRASGPGAEVLGFRLKGGETKPAPVSVGGPGWKFSGLPGQPLDALPPGRYSVRWEKLWRTATADGQLRDDRLASGLVDIEVVGPGKAVTAEAEFTATKYLAEHTETVGKGSCFVGEVTAIGNLAPFTIQSGGERKLREIEYQVDEVLWDNEPSVEGGLKLRKGAKVRILQTLSADGSLPAQYTQGARLIVHFGWLSVPDRGSHPNAEGAFPATAKNLDSFRDACKAVRPATGSR